MPSKPAATARRAPAANASIASAISSSPASRTSRPVSALGTAEGASGSPAWTRDWLPAWASWAKIGAPWRCTASVTERSPSISPSWWIPVWRRAYCPRPAQYR